MINKHNYILLPQYIQLLVKKHLCSYKVRWVITVMGQGVSGQMDLLARNGMLSNAGKVLKYFTII